MILKRLKQLLRRIRNRLFRDNLDGSTTCPTCGATKFNTFRTINDKCKYVLCPSCDNLYYMYYDHFHWHIEDKPLKWYNKYYLDLI